MLTLGGECLRLNMHLYKSASVNTTLVLYLCAMDVIESIQRCVPAVRGTEAH